MSRLFGWGISSEQAHISYWGAKCVVIEDRFHQSKFLKRSRSLIDDLFNKKAGYTTAIASTLEGFYHHLSVSFFFNEHSVIILNYVNIQ